MRELEGIEGTFRGIDNLAFQYEVEQGKLGKKVNVISNVEGVSLNKTSNILK